MTAGNPLLRFRSEFPILAAYLISNSLGAMPRAIDEIRSSGAWRRWVDRPAVVT